VIKISKILVLGSGQMGRAIAYDLSIFSDFKKITICDKKSNIKNLNDEKINFLKLDVSDENKTKKCFQEYDTVISAVPYLFNYDLTKISIDTNTNFLDLGGNNTIVEKQKNLSDKAEKQDVTIIPDCGLAPGLVSIITKDIYETLDEVKSVHLRVGGLPQKPKPPLNYQIVFSPNGLLNEYIEDAIVLEDGKIMNKKSMTEVEKIFFPKPFDEMEAFITSGGCSTLPYSYKDKICNLDYKTIRYPGHCENFKKYFDLKKPREILMDEISKNIPKNGKDLVLLKVFGDGLLDDKKTFFEYNMIDYYDEKNNITSMMRTTGYPVSIIAQMIDKKEIKKTGVFCCEEIIPIKSFFNDLRKRNINIDKKIS